jgi:hypothetical protein
MKKILLFAITLCGVVAFTSCSKTSDYTCTCDSPSLSATSTYTDYDEDEAKTLCDSERSTYTALGGTCTFNEI